MMTSPGGVGMMTSPGGVGMMTSPGWIVVGWNDDKSGGSWNDDEYPIAVYNIEDTRDLRCRPGPHEPLDIYSAMLQHLFTPGHVWMGSMAGSAQDHKDFTVI
jgi:hypothetical protein